MTVSLTATKTENSALVVEKRPLERYAAPAIPSLVGLSRDALTKALGAIDVPERQRRMRAQQIWHWLYVRGAQSFDEMTTLSKDLRAALAATLHGGTPRNRRRADFRRRHPQVAASPSRRAWRRAARGRMRLHSGDRPRHVVPFEPGRLHADLHLLPHRHAAAGAQSDGGGDRGTSRSGARSSQRLDPCQRICCRKREARENAWSRIS